MTYAAPNSRNYAALPKSKPAKKPEPAYHTLPPIYDSKIAAEVYDRTMSVPVTITQRELLCLSPEVRSTYRESVSAKRDAPRDTADKVQTIAYNDRSATSFDNFSALVNHSIPLTEIFVCDTDFEEPSVTISNGEDYGGEESCDNAQSSEIGCDDSFTVYSCDTSKPATAASMSEISTPSTLFIAKVASALQSVIAMLETSVNGKVVMSFGISRNAPHNRRHHVMYSVPHPSQYAIESTIRYLNTLRYGFEFPIMRDRLDLSLWQTDIYYSLTKVRSSRLVALETSVVLSDFPEEYRIPRDIPDISQTTFSLRASKPQPGRLSRILCDLIHFTVLYRIIQHIFILLFLTSIDLVVDCGQSRFRWEDNDTHRIGLCTERSKTGYFRNPFRNLFATGAQPRDFPFEPNIRANGLRQYGLAYG